MLGAFLGVGEQVGFRGAVGLGRGAAWAGAGLVYDSVPENEQQECINKAKALVRAAEEAVRMASRTPPSTGRGNGGPFA